MLRYILLLICFTTFIVLGVNDIHRIAPGKFRFDDDIAYLKDDQTINYLTPDVNTGKTEQKIKPTSEQIQQSTHANREERQNASGHHDGSFIRLSSSDSPQRTQSIGYTVESYPNPVTNPGLCIQASYGTHSMLCDPDGILNETQQIELNNLLLEGTGYRVFLALAHTILVPMKETSPQETFTGELLRLFLKSEVDSQIRSAWGTGEKDCLLMVYVEDQGKLTIATNIPKDRITKGNITEIEDVFKRYHDDLFVALNLAINTVKGCLAYNQKSNTIMYILILALLIAICVYMSQKKMKQN